MTTSKSELLGLAVPDPYAPSLFDTYEVTEVGKVTHLINGCRWGHGSAGPTNTAVGSVCPVCKTVKKTSPSECWLFWPMVGMVCVPCSRTVCEATPWEPLFMDENGPRFGITKPS